MINTLKVMLWNANGVQKHKKELEILLNSKKIDVCLVAETHFTKESYFKIQFFETYHTTHPMNCARGGSAVIIRSNIKHQEEEKISTDMFQATTVSIHMNGSLLSLVALYSPPRHNIKAEHYKKLFHQIGERFIIGGAFNAKHSHWGSRLITPKGKELLIASQETGCTILSSGKPTYWPTDPNKIPDIIDFFVMRKFSKSFIKIEDGYDLNSDHSPIYLTISSKVNETEPPLTLFNKNTDWVYFRHILSTIDFTQPTNIDEVEDMTLFLTNAIQKAAWASSPEQCRKPLEKCYPPVIMEMVSKKRKLRRKWQQTRRPTIKTQLNRASKELRQAIMEHQNSSLNKYLRELSNEKSSDYSLWKAARKSTRPQTQSPPLKNYNGQWARSNEEKASLFSEHLETTFTPNNSDEYPNLNSFEYQTNFDQIDDNNIPLCTLLETKNMIKTLSLNKAPGFDLITSEILNQIPNNVLQCIQNIINACFTLKYVPSYWKVAEVIMIAKPGKPPNEITSYRPISLLPVLSKLLEKLFLQRIMPIVQKKLIPNHQFGFREGHSTIDQVHRITDTIETAFEEKKICSAVFLDVSQAFDKVWHQGLIYKLRCQLPISYCNFLESYIKNRYFRIKQQDAFSSLKPIRAGVPQGSTIGPLLYLLYTSDLPTPTNCLTATFADDTAILTTGKTESECAETLQTAIDSVVGWTKQWRINFNSVKSVHIDFTTRHQHTPQTLYIEGVQIPYSNTAKYLGMTLDTKLRWKEHVKKKVHELKLKLSNYYWLLGKRSKVSTYNKILIYKQVLKPVWTYGIQLWGCTNKKSVSSIQKFQNKVIRLIMNCPWYIRDPDLQRDIGIDPVAQVIQKSATSHALRLSLHSNEEAQRLINAGDRRRRLQRKRPLDLVLPPITP